MREYERQYCGLQNDMLQPVLERTMEMEYESRGIPVPENGPALRQREHDLKAVASTPEGRRVLRAMAANHRNAGHAIDGGAALYASGLCQPGRELESELRRILPRETFLEIIYPHEEEV